MLFATARQPSKLFSVSLLLKLGVCLVVNRNRESNLALLVIFVAARHALICADSHA